MNKTILKAEDLSKSFANDGEQNHVLNNIDVDIYDGDFTVIMGRSGSGKSTLLYCLSGMEKITCGKVIYNEQNITEFSENKLALLRRGEFGFVFQQMHLVSNLTVYENVIVPGYLSKKLSPAEVRESADSYFEKMNLNKIKKRLPSQVSGGEAQRAAIARAIINKPKLLFADEPTGALNRNNTKSVLDLLTSLNEDGQNILMVTHDVKAALRASRILYIEDGKVSGELIMAPYKQEDEKAREEQVNSWLVSLSW